MVAKEAAGAYNTGVELQIFFFRLAGPCQQRQHNARHVKQQHYQHAACIQESRPEVMHEHSQQKYNYRMYKGFVDFCHLYSEKYDYNKIAILNLRIDSCNR